MTITFDYNLNLHTGETLFICEIDKELNPELNDIVITTAIAGVLNSCPRVPRSIVEEAKRGLSKRFSNYLKSPISALLKLDRPLCGEIQFCSQSNKELCTTKHMITRNKRKIFDIPVCWVYRIDKLPTDKLMVAKELSTFIVHMWKDGKTVIIVD